MWGEECTEYVRVCKIRKQIVSKWAKRLVLEFITLQWSIVMRAELEREHWLRVGWCWGGCNGRKHPLQFCQCLQLYTCCKYYEKKYLQQIFQGVSYFYSKGMCSSVHQKKLEKIIRKKINTKISLLMAISSLDRALFMI